jgi:hypothetical protein
MADLGVAPPDDPRPHNDDGPQQLFLYIASGIQAITALWNNHEPERSIIFLGSLVVTTFAVFRMYRRPPNWFVVVILMCLGLYIVTSVLYAPNGVSNLKRDLARTLPSESAASSAATTDPLPIAAVRYVYVSVFTDPDESGLISSGDTPLAGLQVGLSSGEMYAQRTIVTTDAYGKTPVVELPSRGEILVWVCGSSHLHEISKDHVTAQAAFGVLVGLSPVERDHCLSAKRS